MVQFALKQNNQMITVPLLGYVINVSKRMIQGSEFIDVNFARNIGVKPHGKLAFTVMVERYNGVAVKEKYMYYGNAATLTPFKRIIKAVKYLEHSPLRQHILKPTIDLYKVQKVQPQTIQTEETLNVSQCNAVLEATNMCLRKEPGIYLIQGPPGTGKSMVIISIIQQILFSESRNSKPPCILITAPSNAAVDEIALRLIKLRSTLDVSDEKRKKIKLVRIGPKNMIHPDVQDYYIHDLVRKNVFQEIIRDQHQDGRDHLRLLNDNINALKRNCTTQEARHKLTVAKIAMDQAIKRFLKRQYQSTCRQTEEMLLSRAGIICTTLSSCVGSGMWNIFNRGSSRNKISCCIVDEATKSNEQETLIPLSLNIDKLVLVGDPKQLPAVILSKDAKDHAHGQSLFSRIMSHFDGRSYNPIRMLNCQYRMHPEICKFPNKTYYGGKLQNAPILQERDSKLKILKPYLVFNLKTDLNNSQEYSNKTEVACITKLLNAIEMNFRSSDTFSVGIITPYNDQKERIKAELKERRFKCKADITVNTVDSFQGQEKDIIILSFVRESSNQFVSDEQRLNVALTRAMHALYIIGSKNLYDSCNALEKIYEDAKHRGLLKIISYQITTKSLSQLIKV
ncbi:hypothetical protein ILUMI_20029 [Ignelater luminosus]|uniref:Helicase sen1 n=1 Tax=Ignelater luminosus TaxID=2038154 RepID=A0A8K0CH40_IGNLU|nr:hypothetical protein ILUMI_20029 [Ignelater luminosus]